VLSEVNVEAHPAVEGVEDVVENLNVEFDNFEHVEVDLVVGVEL